MICYHIYGQSATKPKKVKGETGLLGGLHSAGKHYFGEPPNGTIKVKQLQPLRHIQHPYFHLRKGLNAGIRVRETGIK